MCEKSFTFIERTDDDNGALTATATLTFGEVEVGSVKELVDHVLAHLSEEGEECCISSLMIIGHGTEGSISVGNGMTGTDGTKEIGALNTRFWRPELARLACRFCDDSEVYLYACNVGAGHRGAQLLHLIQQTLRCATVVAGPTGVCTPFRATGEDQTSRQGDARPPEPKDAPDQSGKKKRNSPEDDCGDRSGCKKFGLGRMIVGGSVQDPETVETSAIVGARLLPRRTGEAFGASPEHMEAAVAIKGHALVSLLVSLDGRDAFGLETPLASVDGYLQLEIARDGDTWWTDPMALLGGMRYLAPIFGSVTLVHPLFPEATEALAGLADRCGKG